MAENQAETAEYSETRSVDLTDQLDTGIDTKSDWNCCACNGFNSPHDGPKDCLCDKCQHKRCKACILFQLKPDEEREEAPTLDMGKGKDVSRDDLPAQDTDKGNELATKPDSSSLSNMSYYLECMRKPTGKKPRKPYASTKRTKSKGNFKDVPKQAQVESDPQEGAKVSEETADDGEAADH